MVRLVLVFFIALASSGCAALVALGIGVERGRAHVHSHSDVLADGTEVVYWERASKNPKARVVLLHGFGGNRDHWTRFAAMMPEQIDVLALDLPGFGESTKDPKLSYDVDMQAKRLHAFLTQRGLEKFHLFGNSHGGHIATYYALAHPERVQSLALFAPGGGTPSISEQHGIPLVVRTEEDFDALLRGAFVKPPKVPGIVKGYFVEQAAANAEFTAKIREDAKRKPQSLFDRIADLKVPALVVWGDTDRVLDPRDADVWRARLPTGDVVIMRETGHSPIIERPRESVALVLAWWKRAGLIQ